jgi:hypothetical protein
MKMNARQKAKYYKRKYEELLYRPLPKATIENRKIDTLRYEKLISEEYIFDNLKDSGMGSYLLGEMEDSLREEIRKYYNWHLIHIPEMGMFKFTADLKLVDPGISEELIEYCNNDALATEEVLRHLKMEEEETGEKN